MHTVTLGGGGSADAFAAVAVLRRFWLAAARLGALQGDDTHADVVASWLASLPAPGDGSVAGEVLADFELTVTVDGSWARVAAFGDPAAMIGPSAEWFSGLDPEPAELERLAELGPAIDADLLATWMESHGDSFDAGWSMRGALDPATALDVVDDAARREVLVAYLSARDADSLRTVGRAVSRGRSVGRVAFDAGSAASDDDVAGVVNLLADLGAPTPSDAVLGAVLSLAGSRTIGVEAHLLVDGFTRVAVSVSSPPLSLLAELARLQGADLDRLAAVQGTLDDVEPERVCCWVTAGGERVEVVYRLAAS